MTKDAVSSGSSDTSMKSRFGAREFYGDLIRNSCVSEVEASRTVQKPDRMLALSDLSSDTSVVRVWLDAVTLELLRNQREFGDKLR